MRRGLIFWLGLLFVLGAGGLSLLLLKHNEPKRISLVALDRLDAALKSQDSNKLLDSLVIPKALVGKTPAEQSEFIRKVLRDEITAEGIAELKKNAQFGPLKSMFPEDADRWAGQAGVAADQCVAFRLDRTNGFRAEAVLYQGGDQLRIVRLNNVRKSATPLPR